MKRLTLIPAVAAALALSACGSADNESAPTTEDGAIKKQIGEWGGYGCPEGDSSEECVTQFKLDSVEVGDTCEDFGMPSVDEENQDQNLLQITATTKVKAGVSADDMEARLTNNSDWNALRADGITEPLEVHIMCLSNGGGITDFWADPVAPGTTVERSMIYRAPDGMEKIELIDSMSGTRWQWDMPQQ